MPRDLDDIEPPSYDHALQSSIDAQHKVHLYGLLNDASRDSFEKGEMFIQAFRTELDRYPTAEVEEIKQNGLINTIRVDEHTQHNELHKHPKSRNPSYPPIAVHNNLLQFWPTIPPYSSLEDYDITAQATHPYLSLSDYHINPPSPLQPEHYFEVTVVSRPPQVVMAIGLSTKPYPLFRMPGWNKYSVGYHSDDGHKFCDDATGGQSYGPSWDRQGDVVGCGYFPDTGNVYFTKNGSMLGYAFTGLQKHCYYASVGADGPCQVKINYGREPFRFNVNHWMGNILH